jgi:gamma-glutamylcyclotransferase (GGCT)/AIG2-like uncharacterized protein YtfP
MNPLFAYGSLMCDDIMQHVSGMPLAGAQGTLAGYRRFCLKGEDYPAMVPDPGGRVRGVIYLGLTPLAWDRLDRFEGEMYARQTVTVRLDDGRVMDAATYILRPTYRDRLEDTEWDYAAFLKVGKARFLRGYAGYQAL